MDLISIVINSWLISNILGSCGINSLLDFSMKGKGSGVRLLILSFRISAIGLVYQLKEVTIGLTFNSPFL